MISEPSKPTGFNERYEVEEATEMLIERADPTKTKAKKERSQFPSSKSFNVPFQFVESGRRNQVMICEGRKYIQNNKYGEKIYWKCSKWHDGCKARAITLLSEPDCIIRRNEHNHPEGMADKDEEAIKIETSID